MPDRKVRHLFYARIDAMRDESAKAQEARRRLAARRAPSRTARNAIARVSIVAAPDRHGRAPPGIHVEPMHDAGCSARRTRHRLRRRVDVDRGTTPDMAVER